MRGDDDAYRLAREVDWKTCPSLESHPLSLLFASLPLSTAVACYDNPKVTGDLGYQNTELTA
jgi:hypothetical protein